MTLIEFFKEAAYLTLRRELLVVKGWVSKNKHLNDGCICLGNWSVTESSKKQKQKKTKNKRNQKPNSTIIQILFPIFYIITY